MKISQALDRYTFGCFKISGNISLLPNLNVKDSEGGGGETNRAMREGAIAPP